MLLAASATKRNRKVELGRFRTSSIAARLDSAANKGAGQNGKGCHLVRQLPNWARKTSPRTKSNSIARLEPGRKPESTSHRPSRLRGVGAPGQVVSRECRTTRTPYEPHTALRAVKPDLLRRTACSGACCASAPTAFRKLWVLTERAYVP